MRSVPWLCQVFVDGINILGASPHENHFEIGQFLHLNPLKSETLNRTPHPTNYACDLLFQISGLRFRNCSISKSFIKLPKLVRTVLEKKLIKVKEVAKKAAPPAVVIVVIIAAAWVAFPTRRTRTRRPLDDLVQLATVEPDSSALRAIVDFDSLSVGHFEFGIINWAFHSPQLSAKTAAGSTLVLAYSWHRNDGNISQVNRHPRRISASSHKRQ
jgi:hypothetical protein